jgi:WD40 repeat protein/tetratricopeptide (TPR) repeat protein
MDIVVGILWARIGTKLPPGRTRADGSAYASGTEYELDEAARCYRERGTPDLLVYRKISDPPLPLDETRRRSCLEQLDALDALFKRWFFNDDGSFRRAFRTFKTADEFERQLEMHLRGLIRPRIEMAEPPLGAAADEILICGSPYRGLEAFDIADAPSYFGRDRALDSVREALVARAAQKCAFLLIFGMSGSGKSSLVRAGLLHSLVQTPQYIPGIDLWRRSVMRPGDASGDLVECLAQAILGDHGLPELRESGLDAARLARTLRDNPDEIDLVLRPALHAAAEAERTRRHSERTHEARLIAVVDQMEEIFTREGIDEEGRAQFIAALGALARSGLAWVVATMRSDVYLQCGELAELMALKEGQGQYDLARPTFAEIGQMIRLPARDAGLRWGKDPANPDRTLDDVLQEEAWRDPKCLPLLQFTLHELFVRRAAGRTLTFATYIDELGGLEAALARRAEAELERLDDAAQAALPALLRSLVTVAQGDGDPVVARRVPLVPLQTDAVRKRLLDVLIDARLLTTDRDEANRPVVGVGHEHLLTHWPRLKDLLDADREFLRNRAELADAARRWQRDQRSDDRLLSKGKPLAVARDLLASRRGELDPELIEYIDASTQHHDRARRLRRNFRTGVLSVVSVLFVISFVAWRYAEGQRVAAEEYAARLALERGLSLCSQGESHRGMLWLLRALKIAPRNADNLQKSIRLSLDAWGRPFHRLVSSMEHHSSAGSDTLAAHAALAFSPDGKRLATASGDTARLWDTATAEPIGEPLYHLSRVRAVAFSPDGTTLATASDDATARLWVAATAEPIGLLGPHEGAVQALAFSSDGKLLATACEDKKVRVWRVATQQPAGPPIVHAGPVLAVAFSPDATRLATAAGPNARVWDVASGKLLADHLSHPRSITAIAFSADGLRLATASEDTTARLRDIENAQPIGSPMKHDDEVLALAFSPDGVRLATASKDTKVRLWNATTAAPIDPPLRHKGWVRALAFSHDGTRLVTASEDARLWDVVSHEPIGHALRHPASTAINAVAFSPDCRLVATLADDETVRLWDVTNPTTVRESLPHRDLVRAVAFSPDGTHLATGADDRQARLWDVPTARPIGLPMAHGKRVAAVAFSPDGRRLATASDDGTARLWVAATAAPIGVLRPHGGGVCAIAFSPDRKHLATGSDDQKARLWDVATQTIVGAPMAHRGWVRALAFSPGGEYLATGGGKTVRLWDATTSRAIGEPLRHRGYVNAVAFNPAGRLLATASDTTVQLWDVATQEPVGVPMQLPESIPSLAFSPDGTLLAIASGTAAQIWDVATALPVGPPLQPRSWVAAVAFSPNGKNLATGCMDTKARIWDLPTPVEGDERRIVLSTEVLTTMQLNDNDRSSPLTSPVWTLRQRELGKQGGSASPFHRSIVSKRNFHDREASRNAQAGCWLAALWHIDRMIEESPQDSSLYARRGSVRVRLGRWSDAADDFATAANRTDQIEWWYDHALLRLHLGDETGYRTVCNQMLDRFGKATDDANARRLALTWSLAPDSIAEPEWHLRLAQTLVANHREDPSSREALGIAFFRKGDFEKAVEQLSAVVKTPEPFEWLEAASTGRTTGADVRGGRVKPGISQECAVSSRLYLAMAYKRLGRADAAERLIVEAKNRFGTISPPEPNDDLDSGLSWSQRLHLARLLRETEEALKAEDLPARSDY